MQQPLIKQLQKGAGKTFWYKNEKTNTYRLVTKVKRLKSSFEYVTINNSNIHGKIYLCSDWLWAGQFQGNTVPKNGNTVICTEVLLGTVLLYSCVLLICYNITSRAIWKNTNSWIFQRSEMAFVLLVHAFWKTGTVFEKLACACFSQIALETMVKPVPTAL